MINFKLGFRTLFRNRQYTLLNILGLSIGMASAMLIYLWVSFQVSFDRFHEHTDDIYRVIQDQYYTEGEVFHVSVTPAGISKLLKENISGIKHSTRYSQEQALIQVEQIKVIENIQFVDPDFFSMFSFPLLKGDPKTALLDNHSMVITEEQASKLFGNKDPVGQLVLLEGQFPFTITGIIANPPKNTEITYNFLIPFNFYKELGADTEGLGSNWLTTYVQLLPGHTHPTVDEAIELYKKQHFPDVEAVFFLQPLKNMHLYSIWGGGPIKNVKLFSIIAALLILVAAINFTNLSTAMATIRFREIGIKKSFGASRRSLIFQFLGETLLLTFFSMFIALILTESFLPWYNSFLKTKLEINYFDLKLIGVFLAIMAGTGFLSGAYPALFLSAFRPTEVLKKSGPSQHRSLLREMLVILQFGLAIVLIINTITIKKQQNYLRNQDVGLQKENIMYIPLRGELKKTYEVFKSTLLNDADVKEVCFATHLPTTIYSNGGGYKWRDKSPEVDPLVSSTQGDFDYARLFDIAIIEGEFYRENNYYDTNHIVINKTFADIIGLKPIIGEELEMWGSKRKIIGVTEDFNFKPLYSKIEPLVITCWGNNYTWAFCKISSQNMQKTIKHIEKVHNEMNGSFPFEYHFLDEAFDELYANEERQGKIFNVFAFLAILISCLGLLGLSSFMMTQRTKEIGIRKVNGASNLNILLLFSRYFTRWVMVSFVIAVPVSYYLVHKWLENYAYQTSIAWWIFALAGAIAFIIALATVCWQSWKAASRNPIDALKYE